MRKNEFLDELHKALENDLSGQAVQENVQYYRTYIEEQVRNGRMEEDVLEELGDPWLIAKTLIDSPNAEQSYATNREDYVREERYDSENGSKVYTFGLDTWWKKLLALLAVVGIVALVISIVMGILSLVLPIAIPVLIILLVIKTFSKR